MKKDPEPGVKVETATATAAKTETAETVTTVKRAPALPGENEPMYDDGLCLLDWCKYLSKIT